MKFIISVLWCIILIKDVYLQKEEGDSCIDNSNKNGTCKPIDDCSSALENLKKNTFPLICGFKDKVAVVCCVDISNKNEEIKADDADRANTSSNSTRIIGEISKAKCKEYSKYSYRKILSPLLTTKPQYEKIYDCHLRSEILALTTIETSIEEYPHMAHVGFERNNKITYPSAGSLISEIFVLTVANSVNSKFYGRPVLVRFGVTNVDDYTHRQEIKIADVYKHPEFKVFYHDIALLKLEEPVKINQFVRPACLNSVRDINYKTAVATGWGQRRRFLGGPSKDLLESILEITSTKSCNETYAHSELLEDGIIEDLMICAKITSDQRKDTSFGDAGSPLQVGIANSKELQCMSLIIGITSFGPSWPVFGYPNVYTRVSNYISWIEGIVWPEKMT